MSRVSIILPSYRQPQFLGRAIESCLEQDHADLEVIVIDDHSRDSSLGVAVEMAELDDRVVIIETPQNGGLGRTRNIGLARATGEYLCFLDSDDYLLPGSISARLAAFPEALATYGDDVVAVYGDWQHVGESMDYPKVRAPRTNMDVVRASNYTGENVFICSAPLVRRDAVLEAGGFPEGLPMLEDFALWSRMIAAGGIFAPVRHVVATYRQRPNSMLRGEAGVTMAEYVALINQWMAAADVALADGGALTAWLEDRAPHSYGRMAWNVPSVMGDLGRSATAASLRLETQRSGESEVAAHPELADFMTAPVVEGLTMTADTWVGTAPAEPTQAVVVGSLRDAVAAVGLVERLGSGTGVFAEDSRGWEDLWPLALASIRVRPMSEIDTFPIPPAVTTLAMSGDIDELFTEGVAALWPDLGDRSGAIVFVPANFEAYPALDAWISTSLHALAERGMSPRVMAEPSVRAHLGGYRSEIVSVAALAQSELIVAPPGADAEMLAALGPLVIFDPSTVGTNNPRTMRELLGSIDAVGARR